MKGAAPASVGLESAYPSIRATRAEDRRDSLNRLSLPTMGEDGQSASCAQA